MDDQGDDGGEFATLVRSVANKSYVPVALCPNVDRVRRVFGDKPGFSIRAALGRNGRYVKKKTTEIDGTDELILAEFVRRVLFMPVPGRHAYLIEGSGVHYVAECTLRELGVPELEGNSAVKKAFCSIKGDQERVLNYASKKEGMGFSFVSVSDAVKASPAYKSAILDALYPGVRRPTLQTYSIRNDGGLWVSAADLFEACEERGVELPESDTVIDALKDLKAKVSSARVDTDGKLTKVDVNFAAGSGPFVSVAWLTSDDRFRDFEDVMEPSVDGYPICLADCLKRTRREHDAPPLEKCKLGDTSKFVPVTHRKKSSVKMMLTSKLKDKRARVFLEKIVDTVSQASRYGSYVMNFHVMRLLDESGGTLSDSPDDRPFILGKLVRKAMVAVRFGAPKDAGLKATYEAHKSVLDPLVDKGLVDVGNTFNTDADMYVTNTLTSLQLAGPGRIATLLKSGERLYGGPKGTVHRSRNYIEGSSEQCVPGLHPDFTALVEKYRTLYVEKGLCDSYGFNVHDMPDELVDRRVRRILELYWNINNDLLDLERKAVATGNWVLAVRHDNLGRGKGCEANKDELFATPSLDSKVTRADKTWRRSSFAYLPVSSLKRRHVRIDKQSFTRACNHLLGGGDIKELNTECFMSLFVTGANLGRRRGVATIRSADKGWYVGDSFMTDGTSLVFTYECALRTKGGTPTIDLPEGCKVVGDDPGRVNIHTTCSKLANGTYVFRELTRNDYYKDSKFDENKVSRERRHKHHASAALEAISLTRRRTAIASEFSEYVKAIGENAVALKAALGCRNACRESFKAYRYKTKTIDRFINLHATKDEMTMYALGNPGFSSSGRGERSVPTSSYGHRIRTAHKASFVLRDVDEHGTTKHCSVTFTELAPAWRKVVCKDGETRYKEDRDVKLCTSESFPLESHSFLVASPHLLEGLEKFSGIPLDRDRNSAYAIRELAFVPYAERNPVYKR